MSNYSHHTHKTYFIDIDGTLVEHRNCAQLEELHRKSSVNLQESTATAEEVLLPGVKKFWSKIHPHDKIIITTARKKKYRAITEKIFENNELCYDVLLMGLASGPRILINDTPDVLYEKAIAVNVKRDGGFYFYESDEEMSNSED